jgi:hypothetical protein
LSRFGTQTKKKQTEKLTIRVSLAAQTNKNYITWSISEVAKCDEGAHQIKKTALTKRFFQPT